MGWKRRFTGLFKRKELLVNGSSKRGFSVFKGVFLPWPGQALESFKSERCLMGISLEVQRNGVCLVPDVQLLQEGVYTRGRYRR